MFKKEPIRTYADDIQDLHKRMLELEGKILNLENPCKYKVGDRIEWDKPHDKGGGIIVEIIPMEMVQGNDNMDRRFYYRRYREFRIFDGERLTKIPEHYLDNE